MTDLHPLAAEGFGQAARSYVRGRPDFPAGTLDWLKDDLHLRPGSRVLELGAGTGKFTKILTQTRAEVLAVEPVDEMLARLAADQPDVKTLRATAQNLPLAGATMDAVICAQAFHWFATADAVAEMRRVLVSGGVLGLIWNVRDESVPWVARLTRIMAPHEGDAPRYYRNEWRQVFPAPGFGELNARTFSHQHVGPAEHVLVDRVASVSFIAALNAATRKAVLREVRALIAATPELANRQEVSVPYVTRAFWTVAR
jgi:SAM-dependent methyltransferase